MPRAPLPIILAIVLSSCVAESPPGNPIRETLPNGALLVRYPDLPAIDSAGPEVTDARVALRFGSRDGTNPDLTFSDIRGIQADSDGNIYVLDQQAVEVRVFDPGGEYLRTIARRADRVPVRLSKPTGSSFRATPCCGCTITASTRSSGSIPRASRCAVSRNRSTNTVATGADRSTQGAATGEKSPIGTTRRPTATRASTRLPRGTTTGPTTWPAEPSIPSSWAQARAGPTPTFSPGAPGFCAFRSSPATCRP